MIFNHRDTGKCAIFIAPYDADWQNQDDPNCFRIRKPEDLPDFAFNLGDVEMPHEFFRIAGKRGLFFYLGEFFKNDFCNETDPIKKEQLLIEAHKAQNDFFLLICPSGFPVGAKILLNPQESKLISLIEKIGNSQR